jgi:ketosteroid isomerase-like protein
MTRTPQEVFAHHGQALAAGDLDEIVVDYGDDSVLITPAGAARGKDGIRAAFARLLDDLPDAAWNLKNQIFDGDVLSLNGPPIQRSTASTTASTPSCFATA